MPCSQGFAPHINLCPYDRSSCLYRPTSWESSLQWQIWKAMCYTESNMLNHMQSSPYFYFVSQNWWKHNTTSFHKIFLPDGNQWKTNQNEKWELHYEVKIGENWTNNTNMIPTTQNIIDLPLLFLATSMLVPLIRRYDIPLWKNPKGNINIIIHYTQSQ